MHRMIPFHRGIKYMISLNKKYIISLIRTILFNWNVFESMENGHLGPIFFSDGTYTWGSVIVCWWSCRTCVKDLLLSAGVEHGVTPPLVSINILTGMVAHPAWLQGHAAAPLCHELQRCLKLLTLAQLDTLPVPHQHNHPSIRTSAPLR